MGAKKIALLFLLCCLLPFLSFSQEAGKNKGKISGRIVDTLNGSPVQYASVSLFSCDSNKEVGGVTSDDKGSFELNGIYPGTYNVSVYFVGYKQYTIKKITIKNSRLAVNLGTIKLASSSSALQTVTVSAEKELIENKVDRMVFNVEKDITSQTGVATDILKKIPEITVDLSGNIELQGNSNIRFLIDGKPSTIFGTNINEVLQTIPASQIKKIEVITNPGAKYDAEGTGGIINIILKKSEVHGINASVSLSAGTKTENAGANVNVRMGNFGAYGYFGGNATLLSTTPSTLNRTGSDTGGTTLNLLQNGSSDFTREGYWTGAGFDWEVTTHDNIYGGISYNQFGGNTSGTTNQESIIMDNLGDKLSDISSLLNSSTNYNRQSEGGYLNYKRTFEKKDQQLEIDCNSTITNSSDHYQQSQQYIPSELLYNGSYGNNPGTSSGSNFSIDYTQPVDSEISIETGAKATFNRIKSASSVFLLSTQDNQYWYNGPQSNSIDYAQDIYAAYFSISMPLFHFLNIKPGLRDEYTTTEATFSNAGNVLIPSYNTLVPSLALSHKFENNNNVRINYSHRIQRPNYNNLDPFVNTANPQSISTGNPGLQPEIGDKIEVGYNKIFEKGTNLFFTLFYGQNTHDIQPYATYYSSYKVGDSTFTNVIVTQPENIGKEENIGLSCYTSMHIISTKLKIRPYATLIRRYIYTGLPTGGNESGYIYRVNANATYEFNDNLSFEVFGNYNSPGVNAQGTYPSYFQYNFAMRLNLFHKKGSIAITATNPFNYYTPQTTNLTGDNFTMVSTRQAPGQSFGINFNYRIGKMEFKDDEHQKKKPDETQGN